MPGWTSGLDENDRGSAGCLPPGRFRVAADAFFARPETSFCGWGRAVDAQARVAAAWGEIVQAPGRIVVVGHGGTGTLLMCRLVGLPISRAHDAPRQGCFRMWDRVAGRLAGRLRRRNTARCL